MVKNMVFQKNAPNFLMIKWHNGCGNRSINDTVLYLLKNTLSVKYKYDGGKYEVHRS